MSGLPSHCGEASDAQTLVIASDQRERGNPGPRAKGPGLLRRLRLLAMTAVVTGLGARHDGCGRPALWHQRRRRLGRAMIENHCNRKHSVLSIPYIRPTGVGRSDDRGPMPKAWGFSFEGACRTSPLDTLQTAIRIIGSMRAQPRPAVARHLNPTPAQQEAPA